MAQQVLDIDELLESIPLHLPIKICFSHSAFLRTRTSTSPTLSHYQRALFFALLAPLNATSNPHQHKTNPTLDRINENHSLAGDLCYTPKRQTKHFRLTRQDTMKLNAMSTCFRMYLISPPPRVPATASPVQSWVSYQPQRLDRKKAWADESTM